MHVRPYFIVNVSKYPFNINCFIFGLTIRQTVGYVRYIVIFARRSGLQHCPRSLTHRRVISPGLTLVLYAVEDHSTVAGILGDPPLVPARHVKGTRILSPVIGISIRQADATRVAPFARGAMTKTHVLSVSTW
jgi:hypothetical protein